MVGSGASRLPTYGLSGTGGACAPHSCERLAFLQQREELLYRFAGRKLIMRLIDECLPVAAPFNAFGFFGDQRPEIAVGLVLFLRCAGKKLARVEDADVPGYSEIVIALTTPCIGHLGLLFEQHILFGKSACPRNDAAGEGMTFRCYAHELPCLGLCGRDQGPDIHFSAIVETPHLRLRGLIVLDELVLRLLDFARQFAIERPFVEAGNGENSLEKNGYLTQTASHSSCPSLCQYWWFAI